MTLPISRSAAFRNVPPKKAILSLESTLRKCETCSPNGATLDNCCDKCRMINTAKKRFEESNIPIMYWDINMDKDFYGDPVLLEKYNEIVDNLHNTYNNGVSLCFAGGHGCGKTMLVTNVLKKAVIKGYQCLYTTLGDIVSVTVSGPLDEKFAAKKELITVDFLVIDEFDPRHMSPGASTDLFGRQLEDVFRRRLENQLPIFMCTNSPQVLSSFDGPLKQSISSLMNYVTTVTVLGKDWRQASNRKNNGH